jgi:tripartite-type tricarboxylate transporter receptor subunit TctC
MDSISASRFVRPLRPIGRFLIACALCAMFVTGDALAAFPDRPVRLIVTSTAGGGLDVVARILGKKLTDVWGQPIVVDNRPGAQGNIGTALGAKAPADGYTITLVTMDMLTINPHIYSNVGFDALKDVVAVSRVADQQLVLVANPKVPARNVKDLVALAKSKPGEVTWASPNSAAAQLFMAIFERSTGIKLLHVPYKGSAQAVAAVLAGETDLTSPGPSTVAPLVKADKVTALAVMGKSRSETLPDVASTYEQGYPELGEGLSQWWGIVAPAGTPDSVVKALNAGLVAALKDPEVQHSVRALGIAPSSSSPDKFSQQIRRDYDRWGKLVKEIGLKVD